MNRYISENIKFRLALESNNLCANPLCFNTIMDPLTQTITGQIAHIIPFSNDGPRGNSVHLKEEEINSFDNLLLLCPECHKIIDTNPREYTIDILREWKQPWLSSNIRNFSINFLELIYEYDIPKKASSKIINYNSYWILAIDRQPVGENYFSDIDYFNSKLNSLFSYYNLIIPKSLKLRVLSICEMFNYLQQCFALKTYPTNINGISTPAFTQEDTDLFEQLNSGMQNCNYILCQILNKLESLR